MSLDMFDDDDGVCLVKSPERALLGFHIVEAETELPEYDRDLQHITRAAGIIRSLENADAGNDLVFKWLFEGVSHFLGIGVAELAYSFGTTKAVINRWLSGETAPHPDLRPVIYNWLRKRVIVMSEPERDQREAGRDIERGFRERAAQVRGM